jgi:peptidoglycan-associated lipoprotein
MKKLLAILFMGTIALSACSKKQQVVEDEVQGPTISNADENTSGDSDSGKATGLQSVNFPYDSFEIDGSAQAKLSANAQLMKDKASLKIQVEGHCDSRGGIQYNLGLGEKRANAVKRFLTKAGVAANRITTVSFGKEKLLDQSDSEEAHAKNRRANFTVTSR